jgi:hypothetical protein
VDPYQLGCLVVESIHGCRAPCAEALFVACIYFIELVLGPKLSIKAQERVELGHTSKGMGMVNARMTKKHVTTYMKLTHASAFYPDVVLDACYQQQF